MDDAMDIEASEPRGTKRTADDAELAPNEQREATNNVPNANA